MRSNEDRPVVILRKKRLVSVSPIPQPKRQAESGSQTSHPTATSLSPLLSTPPSPPPTSSSVQQSPVSAANRSSGLTKTQRRNQQRRQRLYESPEVPQLYDAFLTRWPHLFQVTPATIRPLAIGISQDLCTQFPDSLPHLVKFALGMWLARHRVIYWKAVAQGGARYDLEGNPRGEVTAEQQAHARQQRATWYARQQLKQRQKV